MKAILVVTAILALLALLIRWLAPHECKAILKKLAGVISELGLLFWIVWCALYAARWRIRDFFRTWFGRTAAGVITLGSFYILLDVTGGVIRHLSVPEIAAEIPELPALNLWLEGLLIALAVLVLRHHMLELRIQKRSAEAPIYFKEFFDLVRPMLKKAELTAAEIDQFVEIAGNSLVATLKAGRKKHEFFLSIMKQRPGAQRLFTTHVYPKGTVKIDLSQELPLEISEDGLPNSAAGACFLRNSVIYVPSTRHLSGIEITGVEKKDLRPIGLVYKPIKIEPGPSLLCVPVVKSGVVAAVLNISSSKRDAFMVEDVDIGRLVAALLHDCV